MNREIRVILPSGFSLILYFANNQKDNMPRKLPNGCTMEEAARIAQWVQAFEAYGKRKVPDNLEVPKIIAWFQFYGWKEDDKELIGWIRKKETKK